MEVQLVSYVGNACGHNMTSVLTGVNSNCKCAVGMIANVIGSESGAGMAVI